MDMAEKELPWQGDNIEQSGSLGVGVNKESINARDVAGTINNHTTNNYYASPPEESIEPNKPQTPVNPDQKTDPVKAMVVLSAKLTADNRAEYEDKKFELEALVEHLRQITGDNSIKLTFREKGSIKLFLEGSPESLKKIKELFKLGELTELLGVPVEEVKLLLEETTTVRAKTEEEIDLENKYRLIQEIQDQGVKSRDLSGANLSGAYLSSTYLIDTDLRNANLNDVDLSGANLSGANLRNANLRNANLRNANLSGVNFSGVNLRNANLSGVNFSGVNLRSANFSGANLRRAKVKVVNNFSGANLSDANLRSAYLVDTNLTGANLTGAYLVDTNLTGANLTGAYLNDANLTGANLTGANVEQTTFGNNQGISESMKQDLISQGAIFEDSPGDRSLVLTR